MPTERRHLAILLALAGAAVVLLLGLVAGPIAGGVALVVVAGAAAFALGSQGLAVAIGAGAVVAATFAIGHHDGASNGTGSGTAAAAPAPSAADDAELRQAKADLAGATEALAAARKGRDRSRADLAAEHKLMKAFRIRAHKAERRLRQR